MAEGQTSQNVDLNELIRNTQRQQAMIDLLMSQGQRQQAGQTMSSTLTSGLRDVARSLSNWNKVSKIKKCDYGASGLQRTAFIKRCMDDCTGNDYEEAWNVMIAKCPDVPNQCKAIVSTIREQGVHTITKDEFKLIAKLFVFRKRASCADKIVEEALDQIRKQGTRGREDIHEFYGLARKTWNCVLLAYELEAITDDEFESEPVISAPSRAATNDFVRHWASGLTKNVREHVFLKKLQSKSFTLEDAYNSAQDKIESQAFNDESPNEQAQPARKRKFTTSNFMTMTPTAPKRREKQCFFYEKGTCRKGNSCNFLHEKTQQTAVSSQNRAPKHSTYEVVDSDACKACESTDHIYSSECPNFTGCYRCDSKDHRVRNCPETCSSCQAEAGTPCAKTCSTRKQNFRR